MISFIQWCNDNNGFIAAILSFIGLVLSVTAIIASIRTARLPYKKKLLLGSHLSIAGGLTSTGQVKAQTMGIAASATNVGNRTVNISYLGYAVKKNGRYNYLFPINRDFDSKASLEPSEMAEAQFYTDELLMRFSDENRKMKLYVYAKDTEETEYKRKAGNIGKLIDTLSE